MTTTAVVQMIQHLHFVAARIFGKVIGNAPSVEIINLPGIGNAGAVFDRFLHRCHRHRHKQKHAIARLLEHVAHDFGIR